MSRAILLALALLGLTGCATLQRLADADADRQMPWDCGAAAGDASGQNGGESSGEGVGGEQ